MASPRDCPAIDAAGSIRSGRVIDVLARPIGVHGAPRYLRSDHGPEFIEADQHGLDLLMCRNGKLSRRAVCGSTVEKPDRQRGGPQLARCAPQARSL
jgi:hypothetical protein